jgi:hypothetical protein
MPHVYISYAKYDREFVAELSEALQREGVEVWVDAAQISPGAEWRAEIEKALLESSAVIVVISAEAASSQYIQFEIGLAFGSSKPVFPVIIEPISMDTLNPALLNLQILDISENRHAGIQKIVEMLPQVVRRNSPVAVTPLKSKGYVFISYADEDSVFVAQLREFLKTKGYGYWDYQDSDRDYQTLLFLELEGVIQEAVATLSVLSPDWKRSRWAPKEMIFSEDVKTPVFLLMARKMGPTLVTAGITYIDFTKDVEEGFQRLERELQRKGLS